MVQSVELLLDPGTDALVRRQWDALAAAGLPSQAHHTGASNRPHVTLVVAGDVPPQVEAALSAAAAGLPLPVRLGGVLLLGAPGRRVLTRLVVPSAALLDLQAAVAEVCRGCPGFSALSEPGRWTPHVTLARRMDDDQLHRAVAVLGRWEDVDGEGTAVRRWDGAARREWTISGREGDADATDVPQS